MAKCDQGYLCEVCGQAVPGITDSDLYLRYVIGRVEIAALHREPERHLHCNPVLSQFIVDDKFPPVSVEGDFSKQYMDDESRRREEELVTRGWQRLKEVGRLGLSVPEYPLPGL